MSIRYDSPGKKPQKTPSDDDDTGQARETLCRNQRPLLNTSVKALLDTPNQSFVVCRKYETVNEETVRSFVRSIV